MSDEDLYDEFGNYIGPDLDSSDDDDESEAPEDDVSEVSEAALEHEETADPSSAIVLHEDKEHYPDASHVYGADVHTAVMEHDAMDLDTPLVEPVVQSTTRNEPLDYLYTDDYLGVQLTQGSHRGVAIVGHLHHGKTTLMDTILESTLQKPWGPKASLTDGSVRYTDALPSERSRQMSLTSTPLTTLLPDTRGKSYPITMVDCPGHVQFHDESVAVLRLMDGAVLVVDVVEGIMLHTELLVRQIVAEGLPMVVVFNKMDRLWTELKLPPRDAYYKLQHVLDSLKNLVHEAGRGQYPKITIDRVLFASAQHGWLFSLESYAQVYVDHFGNLGNNLSVSDFAQRLWGDAYLDPETRQFHTSARACQTPNVDRTFVTFVLEPLYKLYDACLGDAKEKELRQLGILLSKDQLRSSARPLLRAALSQFLGTARNGWTDTLVRCIPSPSVAARAKVLRNYTGPMDSELVKAMQQCDPNGPLVIHATKMYAHGQSFSVFGRIYSGTIRPAETVQVLGEAYMPPDDEDLASATVENVSIPRGRSRLTVTLAQAGNWVLLDGIDATISKTATIVGKSASEAHIFKPLQFPFAGGEAVMKLAIEPVNPAELPKMVEGLRKVSKSYPMIKTKVEESGEHVLLGCGELYLDCAMHDLREVYGEVEVKVADPIVSFRETVLESSSIKCYADTTNKRNRLSFLAEPLDEGLAETLEKGYVKPTWEPKKLGRFFQTRYNWDLLSSRSVWAFGDSPTHGTNILLDDTLPGDVDKSLLSSCRSSIVQGFQWATREGPLCEEPVRSTKLKLLDVVLAEKPIHRGGGQIIPTARRVVHSSILTAMPRLMEPVYRLQIQCPGEIVDAIQPLLSRRRGHIVQDHPISGTTLYSVKGFLPVLDSFGFETDLRTFTQGQAMVHSIFDHWAVVPGDPLDQSIILHPLEPSPPPHLARELLVKTRRRKGLPEDVSMSKYMEEGMRLNEPMIQEVTA